MAIPAEQVDEAKIEEARARAEARLREKISDEEVATVNASLARSLAQLQVKRRRPPVITVARARGRVVVAVLLAVLCCPVPAVLAGQVPGVAETPLQTQPFQDPEAQSIRVAPVLVGGEPTIWVPGVGPYTPQFRADRIGQRLHEVIRDRSIRDPTITVTENDGSSELRVGSRLLMVVTQLDARSLGASRAVVAEQYARELESVIRAERLRYAPATLIRAGVYGFLATLALAGVVWLIRRLARALHNGVEAWRSKRPGALRLQQAELISADRVGRAIERTIGLSRFVLIVLALDLYLTYVLGLFPWTRAVSARLFDYVVSPIRVAAAAVVGYLPNLLFVVVIGAIIYGAIRLVGLLFDRIHHERVVFPNFPAEWAAPTNKIVRVLLIAFGVVVAFPYLPAQTLPRSPASRCSWAFSSPWRPARRSRT